MAAPTVACRLCGSLWPRSTHRWIDEGGGCPSCAGSPLCNSCGHPRSDHVRVYVKGGKRECRRRIGDFQTLSSAPCDCAGYVPLAGALADAEFAQAEVAGEEPLPALRLAPPPR